MKNTKITSKCLVLALAAAMAFLAASCGGGGGGGTPIVSFPSTTATVTGTIGSITADSGSLGRAAGEAGRTAMATATVVTDFSDFTVTAGGKTGTISGNKYTITNVPPGSNILVEIKKGKIHLKAYLPTVEAGKSITKAVSVTTTAAAVVWEEMGRPEGTSVENLESDADVANVAAAISAAIQDSNLVGTADTVLDAASVKTQITTAKNSKDETAPTISSIYPNGDVNKLSLNSTTVRILFNELMDTSATPTGISLTLKDTTADSATTTVSAPAVSWATDTKTLLINHATTMQPISEYTLTLTLDPTKFSDAPGNAMTTLPTSIHGATVSKTANTITVKFKTTGYYEAEEEEQNEFADIGAADTTFIMAFSGGTTIAGSGAAYAGMDACQACHDASTYVYYKLTNHATAFDRKAAGGSMSGRCASCHTVDGPQVPSYAAGIDSPTRSLTNGAFGLTATDYSAIASPDDVPTAMRSIQCENCHGPASRHIAGNAGDGDPDLIVNGDQAMSATTCAVCHDSPTHHMYVATWREGAHSVSSHSGSNCSPCHNGDGFLEFVGRLESDSTARTYDGEGTIEDPVYNVNCATCHDPHEEQDGAEHQLRFPAQDLCLKCHNTRGRTPGDSPHYSVQGSILNGWGGMTAAGKMYWSSTNGETAPDGVTTTAAYGPSMGTEIECVDCHMYDAGHGLDHSMTVHPEACAVCHSGQNSASVIGDKQASFQIKYDAVKARLDLAKADTSTFTAAQLIIYNNAKWNVDMVYRDHSKGVHNTLYVNKLMTEAGAMLTTLGY
ncbi:MAG: cytochrome c3 family protein [bacterium]